MPREAEPVVITVVRVGGLAGLRRAWRVDASGPDAGTWIVLVDACPWDDAAVPEPAPDRFTWEVLAAHGDRDRRTVLAERDVDGPWRELIDAVRRDGSPCAADAP